MVGVVESFQLEGEDGKEKGFHVFWDNEISEQAQRNVWKRRSVFSPMNIYFPSRLCHGRVCTGESPEERSETYGDTGAAALL